MFDPQHIDKVDFASDKLLKQFEITPDMFKSFIESIGHKIDFSYRLNETLNSWKAGDNCEKIMKQLV